jgi:hypothetical protein
MRQFINLVESTTESLATHTISDAISNGEHEGFSPYWKLIADARILSDSDAMGHIATLVHDGYTSGMHPTWELKLVDSIPDSIPDIATAHDSVIDEEVIDIIHSYMLVPVAETDGIGQGWHEVAEHDATMWVVEDENGTPVFSHADKDVASAHMAELNGHEAILDETTESNRFSSSPDYVVIINAIHERGERQAEALRELDARGLWLNSEQKKQADID